MTGPGEINVVVQGKRDPQLVRSDWTPVGSIAIEGVVAKQITNVLTDDGYLTELWRADWQLDEAPVGQVFQRVMNPDALSAWHVHLCTSDRLACGIGQLLLVLFDARADSPTCGAVAEFRLGERRPAVVTVPPGVYHGVRNIGSTTAVLVNAVEVAYEYADPDHYRLPADCAEIPYRW
jgi:dTDP-4-dehydrorhamnose 3,5-epimerase